MPGRIPLERDVEKYLKSEVERLGGMIRKYTSPGVQGVPDRIVFHQGNVYFVEVKTDIGILSQQQQSEHFRLRRQGTYPVVLYGHEGVNFFTKEYIMKNFKHTVSEVTETELAVKVKCPICGRRQTVVVSRVGYEFWRHGGVKIHDALPDLSADDREALMTGTCSDCWKRM